MSVRRLSMWVIALLCAVSCQVFVGSASAGELPDGRVYERVSSLAQYGGEVYPPGGINNFGTGAGSEYTGLPFQASTDGRKVAYLGSPTVGGNELYGAEGGNEYLATRLSNGGWEQSNISPTDVPGAVYQAFSSDLSIGFLDSVEPLSPLTPGFGEEIPSAGSYDVLYSTSTAGGEYVPLITTTPPFRSKERFETVPGTVSNVFVNSGTGGGHQNRTLAFAGASADSSHLLFLANDALTGASEGRPAAEGGAGSTFENENNLYEWVDGRLQLVNVLPDDTTRAKATFGGGATVGENGVKFSRVISMDGSRVFWTDLNDGHIYVRENGTSTVEISSMGKYQTASSHGSVVFYTNGDLYKYELEGAKTTDLTPGVPVEKVVGASEDGEYVYYVTTSGEFKLWHDGTTTTIMATQVSRGEVTPDGHSVVFSYEPVEKFPQHSVMVYDADTNTVYCASCTAGGTLGALPMSNEANVYRPRWISADGSRVFFVSREALVPRDTDGVYDVYEWERPGAGSCSEEESKGCVYILSEGTSTQDSFFADASENGDDVFIVTRAKLVDTDQDELFDLYDVTTDGVTPPASSECAGTGCQGLPSAPPIFATPSSVTFEGVGNFAAPAKETAVKPKPEKKIKHKKKAKQNKGKKGRSKSKARKSVRKAVGRKRSGVNKGGRS
jgi:hypothetical protein